MTRSATRTSEPREPVRLSPELLKRVLPRRSLPGSATLPSWEAFAKWLTKTWASDDYYLQKRKWGQAFEAGVETALAGALKGPHADAVALLRGITPASIKKAKLETLAAAECIVQAMGHGRDAKHPFKSLVAFVAAERGLADALRVWMRTGELKMLREQRKSSLWALVVGEDEHPSLDANDELRAAVALADDDAYAEARALAEKARANRDVGQRAHIAYHFPDEPWATEDLEAWLADPMLADRWVRVGFLLSATTDVGVVRRYLETQHRSSEIAGAAFDLVAVLSASDALALFDASLPELLKRPSYGPVLKGPPRVVAEAIAAIGSPEAAKILARFASHPILAPQILEWFRVHPEHTSALEATAKDGTKLASTVDRLVAKQKGGGAAARVATTEELPTVLRDRPWKQKTKAPLAALKVETSGMEHEKLDAELLETDAYRRDQSHAHASRPMTKSEVAAWSKKVATCSFAYADYEFQKLPGGGYVHLEIPSGEGLAAWNAETTDKEGKPYKVHVHDPNAYFSRHGVAAFPGWIRRDWAKYLAWEGGPSVMRTSMLVVSPKMAPAMADVFENRKNFRHHARAWLVRHPKVAAYGLVPDAVGPAGKARKAAEAALTMLASSGARAVIEEVASSYGSKARAAIDVLLARDPLSTDATVPKRPPILKREDLPEIRLRNGATKLDEDAVDGVLDMLSICLPEAPYAGIARLREACDEASLGAFALELLEQWVLGDAPGRCDWMGFAVVHLPSDAGHARLAALAREWSTKNQAKCERALVGLKAIGSDASLLHLTHVASSTRFANLKERATGLVAEAAEARGWSIEELEDRTVPVIEKKDKKAYDAVVQRVMRRLEQLMISGRALDRATFEGFFVKHPIVGPLARALVWETEDGSKRFRVAEDGTFADAGDRALSVSESVRVRLAHPARTVGLDAEWSTVFADYALLPPVEQLGRVVTKPNAKEASATALERGKDATAPAKKLLGLLEARGWRRDAAGGPSSFLRDLGGIEIRLPISPGFEIADLARAPAQKLGAVTFTRAGSPVRLGDVDAIVFSEIARDVAAAAAL